MRRLFAPALCAGVLAVSAAVGLAPATAAAQRFDGDRSYYDRDQPGPNRGAVRQEGGASDRYGMGYGSGFGPGPDPAYLDRLEREEFERGYRAGRLDERRAAAAARAPRGPAYGGAVGGPSDGTREEPGWTARRMGDEGMIRDRMMQGGMMMMPGMGGPSAQAMGPPADPDGMVVLLLENTRQQQAMQEIRRSLQEARTALQQGDRPRTEAALAEAEQTLRLASLPAPNDRTVERWLNQAEQALRRNDRPAVERSLRQAREALRGNVRGGVAEAGPQQQGQTSGGQATTAGSGAVGTGATGGGSGGGALPGVQSGGGSPGTSGGAGGSTPIR
jgi:hypothetical protein